MGDPGEISALKASFRGAVETAHLLADLGARVEALDPSRDLDPAMLDDLARITAAHALASAALRGLVVTVQTRREAGTT